MANRKTSRIAFIYVIATAVVGTCILLYSLMAELSGVQTLVLLLGVLVVIWAILFSFFEVGRIAAGRRKITGPDDVGDPDGARRIIVEPPTGHPYPHHEEHEGSAGSDQGQYTTRLHDELPSLRELLRRKRA